MDASVVICAYTLDRWGDLVNAVRSIGEQTVCPREITVVIDNNPELRSLACDELVDVTVVPNDQAPGLCGARNTGASRSKSAILVFLDDDAIASPEWLEQHLDAYRDPTVLGAGGDIVPLWRSEPPGWLPAEMYWVIGCTYTGMPVEPAPIRNPIGANMSMRADVFARAGGFQPELGRLDVGGRAITGTADETEFCIRASQLFPGGQWMYQPRASVQHVVSPHRATWRHFVERCQLEGGSKAVLVRLRGPSSGLSSERQYATRVLPRGIARELRSAASGEADGLRRAGAIVAGFAITAATYFRARCEIRLGRGEQYSS